MKTLLTMLLVALFIWSPPLSAKFCKTDSSTGIVLCRFTDTTGRPHDATIAISLTKQGWAMTIALFLEDWIMLEGDAKVKVGKSDIQTIPYVNTHRDITADNRLMEAGVYLVSEELLMEMNQSGGKITFWLPANDTEEQEIKFLALRFSKLDEFIEEAKTTLGKAIK